MLRQAILITGFFLLSPVAHAGEPASDDVATYLASQLPTGTSISSFEFKNFESSNAGVGRTAVEGTVTLSEDFLTLDDQFLSRFMSDNNFTQTHWQKCRAHVKAKFGHFYSHRISVHSGTKLAFSTNLNFVEGINGFDFKGSLSLTGISGKAASTYSHKLMIIDGNGLDHPDIKKCLDIKAHTQSADEIERQRISDDLLSKTFDVSRREILHFKVTTGTVIEWKPKGQDRFNFWVPATAKAVKDGGWSNGNFKKGQTVDVGFWGRMSKQRNGTWKISIELSVPDKRGELHTVGNQYYQNGKGWEYDPYGTGVKSRFKLLSEE
jgi:hypothetical protein